ncbi:MAG: hypothetical protein K6356_15050 [Chloroflexus sp.]
MQHLKGVLDLLRQIDEAQQTIAYYEQERQDIFQRQQHLQQQSAPLCTGDDKGALRQRYVVTLARLKDQVAWIDAAIAEQQALIQKLYVQVELSLHCLH